MTTPLHVDEPDTSPQVVRTLLRLQIPELAELRLEQLSTTGSDNTLYRLGSEFVVRLPRLSDAARRLGIEVRALGRVVELPAAVPDVIHAGDPSEVYPYRWAILRWIDGVDAGKPATRGTGSAPIPGATWRRSFGTCSVCPWPAYRRGSPGNAADRSPPSPAGCARGWIARPA